MQIQLTQKILKTVLKKLQVIENIFVGEVEELLQENFAGDRLVLILTPKDFNLTKSS